MEGFHVRQYLHSLGGEVLSAAAFAAQLEAQVEPEVLIRLTQEIALVEQELEERSSSEVMLVREVSRHTLRAGGKRLRPALVTLAAEATGLHFDPVRTRRLGACMEMIHMATLMHDDVIDHAATRRGIETAATKFGNTASILTGDVLLAKAMAILAEDGDIEIIRNVSNAVVDLAEGEVHELETRGRPDLTQAEHFEILRRKTATFIASCCQVGALAAGAPDVSVEALGDYGRNMGMAFQIADDLLDYSSDQDISGKPKWTDFSEGCPTLPLILVWESLSEADREDFESAFGNRPEAFQVSLLQNKMKGLGAFERAEETAKDFVSEALSALEALPATRTRDLLAAVAEFVVWRKA
jgi:octaprenyl-diphosphate synthase